MYLRLQIWRHFGALQPLVNSGVYSGESNSFSADCYPKITMEPKHHPIEKTKSSSKPPLLCSMLIFQGIVFLNHIPRRCLPPVSEWLVTGRSCAVDLWTEEFPMKSRWTTSEAGVSSSIFWVLLSIEILISMFQTSILRDCFVGSI